jgi:N-acetyl-anhydromuramyl-L-alanine amidase AmpD
MPIGSSIIVCGKRFDVGVKTITWEDDPKISAYTLHRTDDPSKVPPFSPAKGMEGAAARFRPRRLIGSDRSLDRLRQVIRQFVVHHDGCFDSRTCFHVLHNERGLSVHFLIDNDGTIFQTLDLVDCAFQAAGVNEVSIGVELANRGDALRFPNDYNGGIHGKRDKVTCTIHGHQFLCWDYTKAQQESMTAIGKCLARIFPNLPQTFPAGGDGEPIWTALTDPREYTGYMGHYHVTQQKWDPGPFDFKSFATTIRGRIFFPVVLGTGKPEVPDEPDKIEDLAQGFFDNNETEGEGGYYPVGPYGQSRLWHGGIHIRADKGTPVYAPFPGKVVAARMTDDCPIGSRNFVLIKHEMTIGSVPIRFWTLFFHLDEETSGKDTPNWWKVNAAKLADDPVGLDTDVAGGELIGHVGEAGPPGRFEGQIHLEVMSEDNLGDKLGSGFWHTVEAAGMGRFCAAPEIIDKIDKPIGGKKDGLLSRAEVMNFYRQDQKREDFRKLAVHHLSEWANNNDWEVALNRSKDFMDLPKMQKVRVFKDQIEPVLWWTDEVQDSAGLPSDKVVWNYHPITFIVWIKDRMNRQRSVAKGITAAAAWNGKAPPSFLKDDADATEGFCDDEDYLFGEASKRLDLEDLARGYPDEK